MQTNLRNIGNSKGVIIPASFLKQLEIGNQIEIAIVKDGILITPIKESLRAGWFDGFDVTQEDDFLADMKAMPVEEEGWEW